MVYYCRLSPTLTAWTTCLLCIIAGSALLWPSGLHVYCVLFQTLPYFYRLDYMSMMYYCRVSPTLTAWTTCLWCIIAGSPLLWPPGLHVYDVQWAGLLPGCGETSQHWYSNPSQVHPKYGIIILQYLFPYRHNIQCYTILIRRICDHLCKICVCLRACVSVLEPSKWSRSLSIANAYRLWTEQTRANFFVHIMLIAVSRVCFCGSHVWRNNSSTEPHSGRCLPRSRCRRYDAFVLALWGTRKSKWPSQG